MRKAAILILGVLPACYLSVILVYTLIGIPGQIIRSGDPGLLLIALWCLAGALGTAAMIFAFIDRITRLTLVGLILGVASIPPIFATEWDNTHVTLKLLLGAPLIVGMYLIFENWRALLRSPRDVDG